MENIFESTKKVMNELNFKTPRTKVGDIIEIKGIRLKLEPTGKRHLDCKDCFFSQYEWVCHKVKCQYLERKDDTNVVFLEVES